MSSHTPIGGEGTRTRAALPSETLCFDDLDDSHLSFWREALALHHSLDSPYLTPEFVALVASVRPSVKVSVFRDHDGRICGVLPFERTRFSGAQSVAGPLSDVHGMIGDPGLLWDPLEWLQSNRLSEFRFRHFLANQTSMAPFYSGLEESNVIGLSNGFQAYESHIQSRGSQTIKRVRTAERKLEREVGPIRLIMLDDSQERLETLMRWKSAQYRANGLVDLFEVPWIRDLMYGLHANRGTGFSGMLSTLWAGDHMLAAHMGMRTATTLHWWFPRHSLEFERYSPGMLLLLKVIEAASAEGVVRVELGFGDEPYKKRFRTEGVCLASGECSNGQLRKLGRHTFERLKTWVKRSPLMPVVRTPGRILTAWERRSRFR